MLNKFTEGEYVYIPSSCRLFQFTDAGHVSRAHILGKPAHVMVLGLREASTEFYNIFYEGQLWSVHSHNMYAGGE
tara:strand:+ start:16199 stop:16423 length:225 start_codon:yes stop_codon:yes gene_type:complete